MSRVAAQLEKKGMPVVLESFEDPGINKTAKLNFMREGVPAVLEVLTPQDTSLKPLIKKVAINAVMARCRPEYMPEVLAISEAGGCIGYPGDSSFRHMFVVSGLIAKEIGMNSGFCYLAPGNPANMTLQRAATLIGINLGSAIFGINVLERTGPLHWGTIFAEDENTPWEGLNEHFGFRPDESVLLAWEGKVQLIPFQNIEVKSAETLLENQVGTPDHAVAAIKTITNTNGAILNLTPDTACCWKEEYRIENIANSYPVQKQ